MALQFPTSGSCNWSKGAMARDDPKCLAGKLISSSVCSKPAAALLRWKAPLHPVFFKVLTTHWAKLAQSRLLELFWGRRDRLAVKSTRTAFAEDPSSILSIHIWRFTTTCNSSCRVCDTSFWTHQVSALLCTNL